LKTKRETSTKDNFKNGGKNTVRLKEKKRLKKKVRKKVKHYAAIPEIPKGMKRKEREPIYKA